MANCENIIPLAYKSAVITAHEVKDKVTIIENYNLPYLFSFLLATNSTENLDYEGILGLIIMFQISRNKRRVERNLMMINADYKDRD